MFIKMFGNGCNLSLINSWFLLSQDQPLLRIEGGCKGEVQNGVMNKFFHITKLKSFSSNQLHEYTNIIRKYLMRLNNIFSIFLVIVLVDEYGLIL